MATQSLDNVRPPQFHLRHLLYVTTFIAILLAPFVLMRNAFYRSPHQMAIESVNGRDGWAREELEGYVVADLNGGTCPINDDALSDIVACKRLRKLTAYQTKLTDNGLVYLVGHKDLKILHLDDCIGITDNSIPILAKLNQLEELSLTGTLITENGLRSLRKALPNCKINPRSHGLAKE